MTGRPFLCICGAHRWPNLGNNSPAIRHPTMKRILCVIGFILLVFSIGNHTARAQTATLKAYGYSISLAPGISTSANTVFFTTWDNKTDVPLINEGTNVVSSELKPIEIGSNIYVTDYIITNSIGAWEYGELRLEFNGADSDNNGIFDFLQSDQTGNATFTGTTTAHWNAFGVIVKSTITGSVARSSGSSQGVYSALAQNPTGSFTFNGIASVGMVSGTLNYNRDNGLKQTASLSITDYVGQQIAVTGSGSATANGTDSLILNAFTLAGGGQSFEVFTSFLERKGKSYAGLFRIDDGEVETSWADFQFWRVIVSDSNDTDGDGIPNFTDPFVPARLDPFELSIQIVGANVKLSWQSNTGVNYELFRSADFQGWTPIGGSLSGTGGTLSMEQLIQSSKHFGFRVKSSRQ